MAEYSGFWEKMFTPGASAYAFEAGQMDTGLEELTKYQEELEKLVKDRQRTQFKESLNTLAKYNQANAISVGNLVQDQARQYNEIMTASNAEIELARAQMRKQKDYLMNKARYTSGVEVAGNVKAGVGLGLGVAGAAFGAPWLAGIGSGIGGFGGGFTDAALQRKYSRQQGGQQSAGSWSPYAAWNAQTKYDETERAAPALYGWGDWWGKRK